MAKPRTVHALDNVHLLPVDTTTGAVRVSVFNVSEPLLPTATARETAKIVTNTAV